MSATTSPPTAPQRTQERGTVIVSVVAQATFLLAMAAACVVAWVKSDYTLLIALAGAAATNATAVVNYWIGSSAGSAKKTDLLAAAPVAPIATPAPVVTPPVAQGATP